MDTAPAINTCAVSLLTPGLCCDDTCTRNATTAILIDHGPTGLAEHTRCATHTHQAHETLLAHKPLILDPTWANPTTVARTIKTAHHRDNAVLDKSDGRYRLACAVPGCGHDNPDTWNDHVIDAVVAALTARTASA